MKKKILITGVAGFIGSHVANRFLMEGYKVVGVDDLSGGNIENIPKDIEFIQQDLAQELIIDLIPNDCNIVLHLAGQSSGEISFDNPIVDLQKNVVSTLNLIKYALRNKVERMVYASSMSVYGEIDDKPVNEDSLCKPLSCYGLSKYTSEMYLNIYKESIPSVSMRMFNVYGPGQDMQNLRQGMVSIFLSQALFNNQIEVKGSLERFRDFIYIDDVVECWFRAATLNTAIGKSINIGTGVRTTVDELIQHIREYMPDIEYYTNGNTPGDQTGVFADTENLKLYLGVEKFTSLNSGLSKFMDWTQSLKL
jgi:UDP-glucose 4-epimerase